MKVPKQAMRTYVQFNKDFRMVLYPQGGWTYEQSIEFEKGKFSWYLCEDISDELSTSFELLAIETLQLNALSLARSLAATEQQRLWEKGREVA